MLWYRSLSISWLSSKLGNSRGLVGRGSVEKNSCARASVAVNRAIGSRAKSWESKSTAGEGIIGRKRDSNERVHAKPTRYSFVLGKVDAADQLLGRPNNSKTSWAWCMSSLPVRIGLRVNSSANTHPTPQTSTAVVYFRSPSKISGGRYHRVTTSPVYARVPPPGIPGSVGPSRGCGPRP